MIAGKTHGWINVYVCNQYGTLTDGKPVYPSFDRALHVSPTPIMHFAGHEVLVGIDFGLTPAAIFAQKVRGRWYVLREIVTTDMGIVRFSGLLREVMAQLGGSFSVWGDPTGDNRVGTDEDTAFKVLRRGGIAIRPTATNDPALRIEAVTQPLERLVDKRPGMIVDPGCRNLIAGFEGGYHYKRMAVAGAERYDISPNKNRFSHVHDALQYTLLGGGEGRALVSGPAQPVDKGAAPLRRLRAGPRPAAKKDHVEGLVAYGLSAAMCMPKPPRPDPAIKAEQRRQRQLEMDRLAEEKKKALGVEKRMLRGSGTRSLLTGTAAGYGTNYTA